jgi:hypothetical protein
MGERSGLCIVLVENLRGKDNLGDPDLDGRIKLS